MMQLSWSAEAFLLLDEGRQQLPGSALEYLSGRGASWLLTRRLHDLSLFHPESVLDLDSLAYTLFLGEQNGANMMVQVDTIANVRSTMGLDG